MKYTDYRQAVEHDKDLCTTIAMEECAELVQAISKAKRSKLDKDNMTEEIADVIICINWLIETYELDTYEIERWQVLKENRIVKRLNDGTFK